MRQVVVARAFLFPLLLLAKWTVAQVDNPYHLNGSATQDNCHCYTLTRESQTQSGSVWNVNKIDLTQPFDFRFTVYLGCRDLDGADGIAFVLQPISTSVGSTGQGLGFEGISPSIGIAIDTYQNLDDNDPSYDNISILRDGQVVHSPQTDVAGPVIALGTSGNIEDCEFHRFEVIWNPETKFLNTLMDGIERVSATIDLVGDVFRNDPRVFWGFTGATGGSVNVQRVCTSLSPGFNLAGADHACYPAPMTFTDSSSSFGTISRWIWDFGDGTFDSVPDPPVHNYSAPGEYKVRLAIVGNDGCLSDSAERTIVLGSKPVAQFNYLPVQPCKGAPLLMTDSSNVAFGTINAWQWSIAGQEYTVEDPGSLVLTGENRIELTVKTVEGCVSDKLIDTINIRPLPCPEFYLPTAFTPNHDGHNDRFEFVAAGMLSLDYFRIYNRYGQQVYSSKDLRAGWDGRIGGIDQPPGTYPYIIQGRDLIGAIHQKKGTVILIR